MEDDAHTGRPSSTIDNILIAIVSLLLDKTRWMMVWEMEEHQVYQKQRYTVL